MERRDLQAKRRQAEAPASGAAGPRSQRRRRNPRRQARRLLLLVKGDRRWRPRAFSWTSIWPGVSGQLEPRRLVQGLLVDFYDIEMGTGEGGAQGDAHGQPLGHGRV